MRNVDLQKVKYEGCILKGVNIPLSRGISRIPSRSAWRDKYPGTRKTRDLLNPIYVTLFKMSPFDCSLQKPYV